MRSNQLLGRRREPIGTFVVGLCGRRLTLLVAPSRKFVDT